MVIAINLISICCVYLRRKLLETNHGKERSVHIQIQKVAIFESDRLKINLIHTSQSLIFFDAFVHS